MTFEDYVTKSLATYHTNIEWRLGQSYFNTLYEINPTMADLIRATDVDPFYQDYKVPVFLSWVEQNWDSFQTHPI